MLVCLDARVPSYRHELLPAYQGQREPFAADLCEQLDRMPEMTEAFGFAAAKIAPYEADDLLATAVTRRRPAAAARSSSRATATPTSSSPTSPQRCTRARAGNSSGSIAAGVRERYGIEPEQVTDLIALRGDPSDNIPGARGIGPEDRR